MKKYTKIQKISDNKFLNLFHMNALTDQGRPFDYYFVSRRKEQIFENICTFKNINGIIGVKHQKCGKISLMNEEK